MRKKHYENEVKFLGDHNCEVQKNAINICIEKYRVNGKVDWYHHLILGKETDKMVAILFCPYCGKKLD